MEKSRIHSVINVPSVVIGKEKSLMKIKELGNSDECSDISTAEEFVNDPIAEFKKDSKGKEDRFQTLSTTISLPMFYGATSSIMTLYYFVELNRRYGVESSNLGLFLALSYATRILFSSLGRVIPKTSAFVGSILTLVGYYIMLLSVHRDMVKDSLQYIHSNDNLHLFVLGSTLTQSNEAMYNAMKIFIHSLNVTNITMISVKLKSNYHVMKISRVISFLTGGILYHIYSIDGVAALGAVMMILQIINLVAFYIVEIYRIPHQMDQSIQGHQQEQPYKPTFKPNFTISALKSRRRIFKSEMSKLHRLLDENYSVDIPSSVLQKITPICAYGRSISVLCIWSSVAIRMNHDFSFNFIAIGSILACTSIADWVTALVFLRNDMHCYFKEVFPSPRDLFYSLIGMTFGCALMVIPLFITFICGFFLFCIFNALLKIILLEMQGNGGIIGTDGILFTTFQRISAGISLIIIPILFEVQSNLPMVLGLSNVLLTLFSLILFLYRSRKVDSNGDNQNESVYQSAITEIQKYRSIVKEGHKQVDSPNTFERDLLYDEQLMISSLIRGKDF